MNQSTKCILVCDDDEGILDVYKIVIEEKGYDVLAVSNSEEIFTLIDEKNPALILVDLWMPELGGEAITKTLKSKETTKHIPIVVVSAHKDTRKIAIEIGADAFLCKPFDISELEDLVDHFVGLH